MKKEKLIYISASDPVSEINLLKYITHQILQEDNALKVLSCYERIKEQIDKVTRPYVGLSAYSEDPKEKAILWPLLKAYRNLMLDLDPNWWEDQSDGYISSLIEHLPPAVKFIATHCNSSGLIRSPLRRKSTLIRAEGATPYKEDVFDYLSENAFNEAVGNDSYRSITVPNTSVIMDKDDIDEKFLKKVSRLLSEINDS